MKPSERHAWILRYIAEVEPHGVDVLNSAFVDAYVEATGANVRIMLWGANKCAQLGRDLTTMFHSRQLKRGRVGLGGNWQPGFPKWVWSYKPAVKNRDVVL